MPKEVEELIAEGFTEAERTEIRDAQKPVDPNPVEEQEETKADDVFVPGEEKPDVTEAEPVPVAEPEPEKPEPEPEPEPKKAAEKKAKKVDESARKLETAEKELVALREKWEEANKKLAELSAPKPEPKKEPEKPAIPDIETDPLGHVAGRLGVTETTLNQVIGYIEQQQKYADQQREIGTIATRWRNELAEYQNENPHIVDAIKALAQSRVQELTYLGSSPEEIRQVLENEELQIVTRAHKAGKNPAKDFYELALLRGYRPPADAPEEDEAPKEQDLKRISAGQKKAAASTGGGDADMRGLTLERILALPSDEYEKLVEKKFGGFNKLRARMNI